MLKLNHNKTVETAVKLSTHKIHAKTQRIQRLGLCLYQSTFKKLLLSASLMFAAIPCFAAEADSYQFTGVLYKFMKEIQGAPIAIVVALGIIIGGFFMVCKNQDIAIKQVICALVGGGVVIAAPTLVTMIPGMQGVLI